MSENGRVSAGARESEGGWKWINVRMTVSVSMSEIEGRWVSVGENECGWVSGWNWVWVRVSVDVDESGKVRMKGWKFINLKVFGFITKIVF